MAFSLTELANVALADLGGVIAKIRDDTADDFIEGILADGAFVSTEPAARA